MCPQSLKPLVDLSNFGDEVLEVVGKVRNSELVLRNYLYNQSEDNLEKLKRHIESNRNWCNLHPGEC